MGDKTLPAIITLSIVVVVFGLMLWGWRSKLKRQESVAPLPTLPDDVGPSIFAASGQYVVTTVAGDWLERIAVHGLGIRTNAELSIHPSGVLIQRRGSSDIFIAKDALREVGTQAGMAGKFVEKDGLIVLTWQLGEQEVDTGFRTAAAQAKKPLLAALKALLPADSEELARTEASEQFISRKNTTNE